MKQNKIHIIERIIYPINKFIQQEKSGGIVLGISVLIALILSNSPIQEAYFKFFNHHLGFHWDDQVYFNLSLLHWINDGLMAIFFFVVGLELKREMVAGELANIRQALLPISAAIGGMIFPAIIYTCFNGPTAAAHGWGIPMATDIAFALGVLYLLGDRIPLSLKVFLTALAIVDDLGAVLVIAIFYTQQLNIAFLLLGLMFLGVMFWANKSGVRNIAFYAVFGILGVWVCFLLSGVHATIAAVLAAFTIPANTKLNEQQFVDKIQMHLKNFLQKDPQDHTATLSHEQLAIIDKIKDEHNKVMPPLQRLEYSLHPWVSFVVVPIFALANAGVSFAGLSWGQIYQSHVFWGVALGLFLGKVIGVVLFSVICIKLKIAQWPQGMHIYNLIGLGFLAAIGFTMSLFITQIAFTDALFTLQAKVGIFIASLVGGVLGYLILRRNQR